MCARATVLAAVALGCLTACKNPRRGGVRLVYALDGAANATQIENLAASLRDRIGEKGLEISVAVQGDRVIVEVPPMDSDMIAAVRDITTRGATLELPIVDDSSEYMTQLSQLVAQLGDVHGIRAQTEGVDHFLVAPDRDQVVPAAWARTYGCSIAPGDEVRCRVKGSDVIKHALFGEPALGIAGVAPAVPPDGVLAYERLDSVSRDVSWRTHYLRASTPIVEDDLANATATYASDVKHPVVDVELTPIGARAYADLVARHPGAKLAVVFEGRVLATAALAPVRDGHVALTIDGADVEARTHDIAAAIRVGILPAIRIESESRID